MFFLFGKIKKKVERFSITNCNANSNLKSENEKIFSNKQIVFVPRKILLFLLNYLNICEL